MFASRYFAKRYFAGIYWPPVVSTTQVIIDYASSPYRARLFPAQPYSQPFFTPKDAFIIGPVPNAELSPYLPTAGTEAIIPVVRLIF